MTNNRSDLNIGSKSVSAERKECRGGREGKCVESAHMPDYVSSQNEMLTCPDWNCLPLPLKLNFNVAPNIVLALGFFLAVPLVFPRVFILNHEAHCSVYCLPTSC